MSDVDGVGYFGGDVRKNVASFLLDIIACWAGPRNASSNHSGDVARDMRGVMKLLIRFGAPALTLSLSIASAASVVSCASLNYADNRPQIQRTPGYSAGTGGAYIGDGSSLGYYTPVGAGGSGG
jgi:hypothetical protein